MDTEDEENMQLLPKEGKKKQYINEVLSSSVACLFTVQFGMVLTYGSPAIPNLQESGILVTESDISWFGSLNTVGAIIAVPIGGVLMAMLGRKKSIMVCGLPLLVGWMLLFVTYDKGALFAGRVLTGMGMGISSMCVPLYIAEISSKEIRGTLGAIAQITKQCGVCLIYCIGIILPRQDIALIGLVIAILGVCCFIPLPESPRWLLKKGHRNRAQKELRWLRGKDADISQEMAECETKVDEADEEFHLRDLFNRRYMKPLMLAILCMAFMMLSGSNSVLFYNESLYRQAGLQGSSLKLALILSGVLAVVGVLPTCIWLDRFGRRVFLLMSSILMTISLIILGVPFYLDQVLKYSELNWLIILGAGIFQFGFALGWSPVAWIVIAEIFPVKIRAVGMTVGTTLCFTIGFMVAKTFPWLETNMGGYGVFWMYSGVAFTGIWFVVFMLPETKGKSLEEIQSLFES